VSLRAVRIAAPREGDVVLVLGAGTIGLGAVHFARELLERGTLVVADPSPLRRQAAERLGADVVVDPLEADTVDVVKELTGAGAFGLGARADAVIDCAGAKAGFADALKVTRPGGTIVLAAMYGQKVEVTPDRIVEKELRLCGSFAYANEFGDVVAHLAEGKLDAEVLISHEMPLARGPEAFEVQLDRETSLKVLVSPRL
jgi:threonine dehydrogenase-like Zn-dependent dehydrogenase